MTEKQKILAAEIRKLAGRQHEWNDSDREVWAELNLQYDREEIQANDPNPPNRIGRDGGRIGEGVVNRSDETAAVALAAWARNAHGEAVPADEFQRAQAYGSDPRSNGFNLRLPVGPPTLGLRFSQPQAALRRLSGPDGGFLTDGQVLARLESALKLYAAMLNVAEIWLTEDGNARLWPTCDDTSNTGYQIGEGVEATDATDLQFGGWRFSAYKLTSGIIRASHELLRDSAVNLSMAIIDKLGERIGRVLNTKATTGGGGSTFLGIVPATPVGKTAASSTAVTYDELIELQHAVDPAHRASPGVGWLMNDTTASYIRRLKDGEGRPLWADSMQAGQPSILLGHPVTINPDMASMTTGAKPILFGRLPAYKIRIVGTLRMRTLLERFAEYDEVGFLGFLEADGALLKASDTNSLSPVQALAMA